MRVTKLLAAFTVGSLALAFVACGGHARQLQAITVSPASASGTMQFTATGVFSAAPSPMTLTSPQVGWCIGTTSGTCAEAIVGSATVDANGNAQCLPGARGDETVVAFDPTTKAPQPLGPAKIFGTAHLSCP
jgi:hypothetical protein